MSSYPIGDNSSSYPYPHLHQSSDRCWRAGAWWGPGPPSHHQSCGGKPWAAPCPERWALRWLTAPGMTRPTDLPPQTSCTDVQNHIQNRHQNFNLILRIVRACIALSFGVFFSSSISVYMWEKRVLEPDRRKTALCLVCKHNSAKGIYESYKTKN